MHSSMVLILCYTSGISGGPRTGAANRGELTVTV